MYAQSYVGEAPTDFYYLNPVGFFKQHLFFRCDIFDLVMFLTGFLKKVNPVMKMAGEQLSNGYTSIVRITRSTVSK